MDVKEWPVLSGRVSVRVASRWSALDRLPSTSRCGGVGPEGQPAVRALAGGSPPAGATARRWRELDKAVLPGKR